MTKPRDPRTKTKKMKGESRRRTSGDATRREATGRVIERKPTRTTPRVLK